MVTVPAPDAAPAPAAASPAPTAPSPSPPGPHALAWPWLAVGVLQGLILVLALLPVHALNGRGDVVTVFGGFAFALTGALLGYRSRRGGLLETVVGGAVVVAIVTLVVAFTDAPATPAVLAVGAGIAFALALAGGVVGSALRRAVLVREKGDRSVSWAWVTVGIALGVMLNGSAVFVVSALAEAVGLGWSGPMLAVTFLASFVVTGLFVGYHAPGHSPRDAVLVAIGVVGVDALLVGAVFRVPFPGPAIVGAALVGFLLVLAGGWAGDLAWQLRRRRRARVPPS